MNSIDISWPISPDMTAYKNNATVQFTPRKQFEHDKVRETLITLSSQTGTHVDAPAHFLQDGITTEQLPLDSLIGRCQVIDMTHVTEKITADDLKVCKLSQQIVLFKTKNSQLSPTELFSTEFIYIDQSAAEYLAAQNIRAVGIDYLGIERQQPEHETHLAFMNKNITIIEGIRLAGVAPKEYVLCCLPLLLVGLDGAPARAVLIDSDNFNF